MLAKTIHSSFRRQKNPVIIYTDLAERLATIGVNDTVRNIQNKIARGGFTAVFFLQRMEVTGFKNLRLDTGD